MVSRRDLSADPARRDAARFRRAAEAGRQLATAPHGVTDLGDGDILWTGADGRHSVRDLPDSITGLEDALAAGLSTTSKRNTVSTLVPSSTEGYPEDALWTQIGIRDGKRVVVGTWQLTGGAWLPVGEDASRLTVGQIDVGLIDVAMVWAEMIEAGSAVIMGDRWSVDRTNLCENSRVSSAAGWSRHQGRGVAGFGADLFVAYDYATAAGQWCAVVPDRPNLEPGGGKITIGCTMWSDEPGMPQGINLVAWDASNNVVLDGYGSAGTAIRSHAARFVSTYDVPATAVRYEVRFRNAAPSAQTMKACAVRMVTIEQGTSFTDGGYFYGNTAETSQYRYRFTGSYNASPSVREVRSSGPRLLLDGGGLHYYDEYGAEAVTLGTVGRNLISVGPATIDDQGGITGRTGSFEALRVGGRDLGELIDTPRIVARGVRTTETNKTTGLARLLEVTAALRPGRLYRIAAPTVQFLSDVGDHDVWLRLEWFDLPWTTWANAARLQQSVAKIGAVSKHGSSPPLEAIFDTTGWSAPKSVGLIVRYDSTSRPTKALCSSSDRFHLIVEDLGPAVPDTGQAWMDTVDSGSSATTKQPFDLTFPTAGWATYARGGARIWGAEPYQGSYNGVDNRETAIFFQDMTAALAGADISSIELAAYATHWWWGSGGVGRWHLHGQPSPGATAGLSTFLSDTTGWARNAWGIYQVPASYFAGFKSGAYRGFGFSSASVDPLYYGQFSGAGANAPYIRIRGVK